MVDCATGRINLFTLLFTMLLVAQVADVVYTREFILAGGEEANPVAAMLIGQGGWWLLLFVKAFPCIMAVIASLFMKNTESWVKGAVWLAAAVYLPLTAYHFYNLGIWTII